VIVSGPSDFFQQTKDAKKIIVIDLGFLGDSVHLTPALWEIRRHYPQAQLHTLSATVGSALLELVPAVTRPWAFPLTPQSPPWWRHWDILRQLRSEGFEVAFNFSGADRTIFMTALIGAKHRLAHEGGRKHFWNHWLIPNWVSRRDRNLPVFEQRRQVLAACGLTLRAPCFDLLVPEAAAAWARSNVPQDAVHFSINSSSATKEWPLTSWVALAKALLLARPELHLIATAGPSVREGQRCREFEAAINNPRLKCYESLSIAQLAALLQRCRLHIGGDSGVLHLAFALSLPTLTAVRQYDGLKEWLPQGGRHSSVIAPSLESISTDAMTEAALRQLSAV
jgi:ADP-heptose:LPS heptosyltransferase